MTRTAQRWRARAALVALAACAVAPGLAAQSIRVRVVAPETGGPLPGALVSVEDDAGAILRTVLSDAAGRARLEGLAPGRYVIRAAMVGRASVASPARALDGDAGAESVLSLPPRPVSPDQPAAQLWDEVRKALVAARWTEENAGYAFTVWAYERDEDAHTGRVDRQAAGARTAVGGNAIRSRPAADLAARGYVRPLDSGGFDCFAPDAAAFLAPSFLDAHRLRVRPGDAGDTLLGLAFEPVGGAGHRADIAGVFWLDGATARLRRIEFRYTSTPWPLRDERIGGDLTLDSYPDGTWVVRRWEIRMPLSVGAPGTPAAADTPSAGGAAGARLLTLRAVGQEVLAARRPDGEAVPVSAFGAVEGLVRDSTRAKPLAGAVVALAGTGLATRTGPDGRFRIDGVPEGRWGLTLGHPRLDSLGVELPAVTVDVVRGEVARAELALPSLETLWAMGAPLDARLAERAGQVRAFARTVGPSKRRQLIRGRVVDAETGRPIPVADVALTGDDGGRMAGALSDDSGAFRLAVPAAGRYVLRAQALGYGAGAAGVVAVGPGEVVDVEVRLRTRAIALDPVVVTVARRSLALDRSGFYQRMKGELGTFFTPDRLERRNAHRTTDLFRMIPGAEVVPLGLGQTAVYFRGSERFRGLCWPRVILDGVPVSAGGADAAELDQLVNPQDIEGMEVYRRPAEVPPQYGGALSGCGVIVIWTKK